MNHLWGIWHYILTSTSYVGSSGDLTVYLGQQGTTWVSMGYSETKLQLFSMKNLTNQVTEVGFEMVHILTDTNTRNVNSYWHNQWHFTATTPAKDVSKRFFPDQGHSIKGPWTYMLSVDCRLFLMNCPSPSHPQVDTWCKIYSNHLDMNNSVISQQSAPNPIKSK